MTPVQNYKIERKEEMRRMDLKTMAPWMGYRFWVTSQGGTYFSIEIAEDQLDHAGELISAKAKKLDSIT